MSTSDDGFGTTSTLTVELDERSLTNVKHQIESEIGTMPMGATDGGAMSAQMAGEASGRERRRRRREYRWARERTNHLEDAVVFLESIEDKVGGGGGVAGIFSELIGGVGDLGGGLAGGAASGIASGVGSAVGTAVGNALSGTTVNARLQSPTVTVENQPIPVEDPGTADVDEPGTVGIEEPPGPIGVNDPSPLSVERDPLPVDREPLPVEGVGGGSSVSVQVNPGSGGGLPEDIPEEYEPPSVIEATRRGAERGGDAIPGVGTAVGGWVGFWRGAASQLPGSAPQERAARTEEARRDALLEEAAKGGGGAEVNVTVDQQNDVQLGDITIDAEMSDGDLDRQLRELEREMKNKTEKQIDEAIAELRRDLRGR